MDKSDRSLNLATMDPNAGDTSPRVRMSSPSPIEKSLGEETSEVSSRDSSSYIRGWRLHTLSLRSAIPYLKWHRLKIIACLV